MIRVLLVSQDTDLVEACSAYLTHMEFSTFHVTEGDAALKVSRETRARDMVVIDQRLADMGGAELCSALRAHEGTRRLPVIMLGNQKSEIDAVVAFEVGADDYLCKPLRARELALRLRALGRRCGFFEDVAPITPRFAEGILVDVEAHEVRLNGQLVALTLLEFRLLDTLIRRRGRLQSRTRLLEDVWSSAECDSMHRTVDTHVRRLRAKLGEAGEQIETVRGIGYRFRA